jgi:hypothetical protein
MLVKTRELHLTKFITWQSVQLSRNDGDSMSELDDEVHLL